MCLGVTEAWCTRSSLSASRTEERARIYSSDSDEGSDDDKAQRLMKAKKLDSDEVGAVMWLTDRGRCEAGHRVEKKPTFLIILCN